MSHDFDGLRPMVQSRIIVHNRIYPSIILIQEHSLTMVTPQEHYGDV